jgi:ATP phosphoribosyltransferase regulatory subunit
MTSHRWLLPEAIEDLLPADAMQVEHMRRRVIDLFRGHGYDLVAPPLLEFVESLVSERGQDLDLRTFKLVDQISGRSMGVRADITPQVARIDAHLLGRKGVTRLCYCGSVLHTLPSGFNATREPLQVGAEIYGHAGLEADIEAIRLMVNALRACSLSASRIDLGHVAVFRALSSTARFDADRSEDLFLALQAKDAPLVNELVEGVEPKLRAAFVALPQLYGGPEVLENAAAALPDLPEINVALGEMRRLCEALDGLPLNIDFADLRGYHYHSGVVFAAYCAGSPSAVALGGRYDDFGRAFGRGRPATGFSMDLRELVKLAPPAEERGAIAAPWPEDDALHQEAERQRAQGERVVLALPGHRGTWREAGCDRILVQRDGKWIVESLKED